MTSRHNLCLAVLALVLMSVQASSVPQMWSHRCFVPSGPENSLAGCDAAFDVGFHGVELDVHEIDGRFYVSHHSPTNATWTLLEWSPRQSAGSADAWLYVDLKTIQGKAEDAATQLANVVQPRSTVVEVYDESYIAPFKAAGFKTVITPDKCTNSAPDYLGTSWLLLPFFYKRTTCIPKTGWFLWGLLGGRDTLLVRTAALLLELKTKTEVNQILMEANPPSSDSLLSDIIRRVRSSRNFT